MNDTKCNQNSFKRVTSSIYCYMSLYNFSKINVSYTLLHTVIINSFLRELPGDCLVAEEHFFNIISLWRGTYLITLSQSHNDTQMIAIYWQIKFLILSYKVGVATGLQ